MKSLETLSKEIADKEKENSMKAESEKRHDDLLGSVKEVKEAIESMKETLGSLSVTVENQVEPKDSVKVENLSDIHIPSKVKIDNLGDIKFPAPVKEVSVKKPSWLSFSGIEENIKSLRKAVIDLGKIDLGKYTKKQDALAVRLVDKDGIGYYNAGGGGGYTIDRTKITDESGRIWNLDEIIGLKANIIVDAGGYLYEGNAVPGSATSSAVWQVSRFDKVNLITVWADGNTASDNIFDDYLTLTYS